MQERDFWLVLPVSLNKLGDVSYVVWFRRLVEGRQGTETARLIVSEDQCVMKNNREETQWKPSIFLNRKEN
jgi:hypothetical protein